MLARTAAAVLHSYILTALRTRNRLSFRYLLCCSCALGWVASNMRSFWRFHDVALTDGSAPIVYIEP